LGYPARAERPVRARGGWRHTRQSERQKPFRRPPVSRKRRRATERHCGLVAGPLPVGSAAGAWTGAPAERQTLTVPMRATASTAGLPEARGGLRQQRTDRANGVVKPVNPGEKLRVSAWRFSGPEAVKSRQRLDSAKGGRRRRCPGYGFGFRIGNGRSLRRQAGPSQRRRAAMSDTRVLVCGPDRWVRRKDLQARLAEKRARTGGEMRTKR